MLDVYGEARKHLLAFLNKVLDGSVTRNELENFVMTGYQTEAFEDIRIKAVGIITSNSGAERLEKNALSEKDQIVIEALVAELDR